MIQYNMVPPKLQSGKRWERHHSSAGAAVCTGEAPGSAYVNLGQPARAGAEIVVATGRIYRGIPAEVRDLPFLRYFILMNGAKVWDRREDRVLYRAEIPLATAERVFDDLASVEATVDCYLNDDGYMPQYYLDRLEHYIHDPESLRLVRATRHGRADFRAFVRSSGCGVQKIQCYFPDLQERARVKTWLEGRYPQLVLSMSMTENLELNDARATKGHALLALCAALGADPGEAAAFGDGTNDLSMLRTAGVGVAMANAHPDTKAVADLITGDNQKDGVAQVLNRWFPA